ncbi:Plasma membrane permease, mediates uptake of glycerophosphoinositol and glycerophosphocholine [Haplosporangium bisporale]|nr:Plasma membrane permease, mediates uptake of glycerophosphoinositol and glycerophosphocholine [Haplosporangium bisporale]
MSDSKFPDEKFVQNAVPVWEDEKEKAIEKSSPFYTIIFSGCALMSDGYQVGVLSLVNVCLGNIYGDAYTSTMSTRLGNALFVGIVLGQIGFGFFADRVGRKVGMMVTTFLVILGAALCAGAYGAGGSVEGLFWALAIYRGILGVGVGGEYPCSSTNASESADKVMNGRRGFLVSLATNFMIDFGFVLAGIVPLILAVAGCSNEVIWRVSFGLGVIPPLSALYFRLRMTNSEIFKKNAMKKNVPYWLIFRRYWKSLLGTAGTWFLYDFIAYPFGLFSGTIINSAIGSNPTFVQTAEWSTLLNFLDLISILPLFVILYGVFLSLGEFGPGDMVIVTSSEIFPTAIRGTAYGWSAAIGKLGAICGTSAFKPAIQHFGKGDAILGQSRVFILASGLALFGSIVAWALIPDYSKQDLSNEDEEFKQYLLENGYDISHLGEVSTMEDVKA